MLKSQVVVQNSWQDASAGGGRRLTRVIGFNGNVYTVTGMPAPAAGGPSVGTIGTLFFLPGEGEYQHAITFLGFEALEGDARQAAFAEATDAPVIARKAPVQQAVQTPDDALAQAQARAARRLANNQLTAKLDAASSEVAPA